MAESETVVDLVAGWTGGIIGILVSNPLEVIKVRLQTTRTPGPQSGSRSPSPARHFTPFDPKASLALQYAHPSNAPGTFSPSYPPTSALEWLKQHSSAPSEPLAPVKKAVGRGPLSTTETLRSLWRQEGVRFLFAGAAAPILGLAFIDSFFFATYGRCMSGLSQDRQDPSSLPAVFASGAAAGGVCALLQTPVEVVKCRAQAEPLNPKTGDKATSWEITKKIASGQGLRGFYIGGLTTAVRDSMSSGIFFASYAMFRRALRGEAMFTPSGYSSRPEDENKAAMSEDYAELGRILLAGGCAGSLSAILPYPLDIVKTRLQTAKVSATASTPDEAPKTKFSSSPPESSIPKSAEAKQAARQLTFRDIVREVYVDGRNALLYSADAPSISTTRTYRLLTLAFPTSMPANRSLRHHRDGRTVNIPAERWATRILGLGGFFVGIKPTIVSAFAGSAVTIAAFEVVVAMLSKDS